MNELELKRQNIEKWAKRLWLPIIIAVVGFLISPFVIAAIGGILGGFVLVVLGLAAVNLAPFVAAKFANWRLKAIKYEASLNPIETLENRLREGQEKLLLKRQNIEETYTVAQSLYDQIEEHKKNFPDRPSKYQDKYEKLNRLIKIRSNAYKKAQNELKNFAEIIEEKRSDWKIAQSFAKAQKLANVGADFESKLAMDTALETVQNGMNLAFSELETSLLDEPDDQPQSTVTVSEKVVLTIPEKCGPPTLDLGFEIVDNEPVTAKKKVKK